MCAKADLDKMQGHAAEKPVQNMVMVVSVTAAVLRVLVGKISSVGGLTSTDQSGMECGRAGGASGERAAPFALAPLHKSMHVSPFCASAWIFQACGCKSYNEVKEK